MNVQRLERIDEAQPLSDSRDEIKLTRWQREGIQKAIHSLDQGKGIADEEMGKWIDQLCAVSQ